MSKKKVQTQFGANAAAYATSKVHAKGASLARLVELVNPQPHWGVLDVATAAGHTAFAFAPYVTRVTAIDLTPQMQMVAAALAREHGIGNVDFHPADAENLPFVDNQFHLVTCRIAPHHFPDVDRFVREAARVLRPNGLLAIVDNIVPGSRLRGRKARLKRSAGEYVNAFERLRDPSHHRCLSLTDWADAFQQADVALLHQETASKEMELEPWAARMRVPADDLVRLRVMIQQAPQAVAEFLTPKFSGDRITFFLTEAILVGRVERID